jgi:hypothetical protein
MSALTTFTTAKGAKIELFVAAAGKINVHANGKWIGIMAAMVDNVAHGKVLTLVGQQTMIAVGNAADDVAAAIKDAAQQAADAAQQADQRWAAYAKTPEGKAEAMMTRFDREDRED